MNPREHPSSDSTPLHFGIIQQYARIHKTYSKEELRIKPRLPLSPEF